MELGNFSMSLNVKDINVSSAFYKNLGFEEAAGDLAQGWLVLQNGNARIGLFQGILDENMLTFNPKWNADKEVIETMSDVREIAETIKNHGGELIEANLPEEQTPGYFYVLDPDGNKILFDQHV
jgi:predicted lactoylglutathione lyase